ncbi:cupredoxin domain-containing protein [Lacisediminimonas profundi]|uniref:cupredoxin domain-containing protein n=1 Tax=Lacisediminimonas profundi TaxID=2603856 RepID=UPI00124B8514|nr:cupredoxin family protein [Lacisediminimonas profundi]
MNKAGITAVFAGLVGLAALMPSAAMAGPGHKDTNGAHGSQSHEKKAWGKPGKAARASRTITITMSDDMRFTPSEIVVDEGQTVRFVLINKGRLMHEMVIGDMAELKAHAELMKKHPDMEHEEEDGLHLKPGARGELTWQFAKPGRFHFACLIPGHFDAGMVGRITVRKKGGA